MRSFIVAIAFLTRIPVPVRLVIGSEDVGRSAKWFPLVGLLLGGMAAVLVVLLRPVLPVSVVAVLIVTLEAFLTGALHMDGLADTADGLGGGRDREHALSIMRDHAVGTYGAVALILLIVLKVTSMAALITRPHWWVYLLLAPSLGRWTVLPLARFFRYARGGTSAINYMGMGELAWGTAVTAVVCVAVGQVRGVICWAAVAILTALFGLYCKKRIGGVTGDTLGANVEIGESAVLVAGLFLY